MKIGWLVEDRRTRRKWMGIDLCKALQAQGHDVTVYGSGRFGSNMAGLPGASRSALWHDELDFLMCDADPYDENAPLSAVRAKLKAYCVSDAAHLGLSDAEAATVGMYWTHAETQRDLNSLYSITDNIGIALLNVDTKRFHPVPADTKQDFITAIGLSNEEACSAPIFVSDNGIDGVLEAMARGRAVVCADVPYNGSFALDEINCLKFPPDDEVAKNRCIARLLQSPGLLVDVSNSALKMARSLDSVVVADKLRRAILERLPQE